MTKARRQQASQLNERQKRFVDEYLVDLNATAAYARAGYSGKGASVAACVLLAKPKIAAEVKRRRDAQKADAEVRREDVLRELLLIALSDIGDILDFSGDDIKLRRARDIPRHARRAISSIKVKRSLDSHGDDAHEVEVTEFKLWSKDAALEKLGRHLALFVDRAEVTGKDGAPLLSLDVVRDVLRRMREKSR